MILSQNKKSFASFKITMRRSVAGLLLLGGILAGCENPEGDSKVLAKVGRREITQAEWDFQKSQKPPIRRDELAEGMVEALEFNKYLQKIQLAEYGLLKGWVKSADSLFALNKPRLLSQLFHRRLIGENQGFTDAELKSFYDAHVETIDPENKGFESLRPQVAMSKAFPDSLLEQTYRANPQQFSGDSSESYDKHRSQIYGYLKAQRYRDLSFAYFDSLKTLYKVEVMKDPEPNLRAIYQAHKDEFKTAKALYLYQVSTQSDSLSGPMGWVKVGHAFPNGLGFYQEIQGFLDTANVGAKSSLIKLNNGEYTLRVDSIKAPEIKPFDRVEKQLELKVKQGEISGVSPDYAWVKIQGKEAIREAQVQALLQEAPPQRRPSLSKQYLLDILTSWELFTREAEKYQVEKIPSVKYSFQASLDNYRSQDVEKQWREKGYEVDSLVLDSLYTLYKEHLGNQTFQEARQVLALLYLVPDVAWQVEMLKNLENYGGVYSEDSIEKYRVELFKNVQFAEKSGIEIRQKLKWDKDMAIDVIDEKMKYLGFEPVSKVLNWAKAKRTQIDSIIKAGGDFKVVDEKRTSILSDIHLALYYSTEYHPESKDLKEAYYELGQTLYDLKRFRDAAWYFERFTQLFPDSPEREKSLFMKGYLYSEHLKKDSLAVRAFEDLLKSYPQSEFADDADFLIRDIRSGRKLSQEFLNSLQSQQPVDKVPGKPAEVK